MKINFNVHLVVGLVVAFASAVAGGTVHLTDAVPASWIPVVTAWSSIVATFGGIYIAMMSQSNPLPVAKAAMWIPIGIALALYASPVSAAPSSAKVPTPVSRPASVSPSSGKITSAQVQANPVVLIQTFTVTDLQAALVDAQGQTPPDTVAAACYSALIPIVQSGVANPLPGGPGLFQAVQKVRDAKALLANLQSPTGPLSGVNAACAPLVLDAQTTLIQLGIMTGVVVGTGGAGLALPFALPIIP